MQLRLSWYVFGPGVQSGLLALGSLGTFSTPTVTTAPARLTNVRREIDGATGVADSGLVADVTSSIASGALNFPAWGAPEVDVEAPSVATAISAQVEALRPRLARVTTATKVETVLSLPGTISEAQRRELYRRIAAALNRYLEANGGFVLQGLSVRLVPARTGSGWGALLGLLLFGGLAYSMTRNER